MKTPFLLLLLACLLLIPPLAHSAAPYRVVAVFDGHTLTLEPAHGGRSFRASLYGIDAPALDQPYGQAARAFVTEAALFKVVDVHPTPQGKELFVGTVAVVELPGVGVLQEMLLQAGLAWVYPRYCKDCGDWEAMQEEAKRRGKGLWADKIQFPPWEWRQGQQCWVDDSPGQGRQGVEKFSLDPGVAP